MDSMKQLTLEDYNNFAKPKKKTKLMIKREALQFLLPLSIAYFILSYYFPSLPCYSSSMNLSIAQLLDHYINKKNLFLFSNIILFLLAVDFSLRGLCGGGSSSSSPMLTIDLYEESLMSIAGHHPPSESMNAIAVVLQEEEEEKKGEIISMVDKIYNDLFQQSDEDVVEEKSIILIESYVKEKDKQVIGTTVPDGFFGDFLARIGDDMPWMGRSIEIEAEFQIKAIQEVVSSLEVVVDHAKIEEEERQEIVMVKDKRMELIEMEELNDKFDEFIRRQRRIWQSESLQLVAIQFQNNLHER